MKKSRFLRQSKHLLVIFSLVFIILLVSAYIYMSLRGEYLLRDFKIFLEKGLSQAFNSKVIISDAKGGIFYPITFSDVVLYSSFEGGHKLLEAKGISINYHLWDILFNRRKHIFKMKLISPKFFVAPEECYENMFSQKKENPFLNRYVQIDIVDGAVVSSEVEGFIIKEAYGSGVLFKDFITLKDISLTLYGLPVTMNGKMEDLYSELPNFDIGLKFQGDYVEVATNAKGNLSSLETAGKLVMANGLSVDFAGYGKFYKGIFELKDTSLGNMIEIDEGYIDLNEKEFNFKLLAKEDTSGEITVGGNLKSWPQFFLYSDIRHWPIGGLDVATKVNLNAEVKQRAKAPALTGMVNTKNTIIDYRPCNEISVQFTLRQKAIEILGLKWGKTFRLVGKLELEPPYNIEMIALFDGTRLDELASFGGEGLESLVAGTIKGRLEIEGPLIYPVSRGHITSRDGNIGDIYYENAVIHLVGKGPVITIGDSRIYKERGYLILSGEIDFRKLGKRNIFEDTMVKTDDQTIIWEGWDITKASTTDELSLKKRINEELEVGLKTSLENGDMLGQERESKKGEVELKYKIRDHESLKMQLKEEEEFLGVEHKVKF